MRRDRIVVIRQLGGIGDVLMMSCVYRGLRETYPKATIQLLTGHLYLGGSLYEIAQRNRFIDEILVIEPDGGTTMRTKTVHAQWFKDCPSIDDNPMLTKATKVIDLNAVCVEVETRETNAGGIVTPRYKIWCDEAGVTPSSYFPVYEMTKADKRFADDQWAQRGFNGKKVVGIGVAACDPRRGLGLGHVQNYCRLLREKGIEPVIINPTLQFDGLATGLVGMRISETMACISKMDAVISPDTGVLHMAGTMRVPVIGVFGPTDQAMRMDQYIGSATNSRNLVKCAPCWYKYPCLSDPNSNRHYACVKKIPDEEVVREAIRWIK